MIASLKKNIKNIILNWTNRYVGDSVPAGRIIPGPDFYLYVYWRIHTQIKDKSAACLWSVYISDELKAFRRVSISWQDGISISFSAHFISILWIPPMLYASRYGKGTEYSWETSFERTCIKTLNEYLYAPSKRAGKSPFLLKTDSVFFLFSQKSK